MSFSKMRGYWVFFALWAVIAATAKVQGASRDVAPEDLGESIQEENDATINQTENTPQARANLAARRADLLVAAAAAIFLIVAFYVSVFPSLMTQVSVWGWQASAAWTGADLL